MLNRKINSICQVAVWFIVLLSALSTQISWAGQVTLQWTPVDSPNIEGYRVYYRMVNKPYDFAHPLWQGKGNKIKVNSLNDKTRYFFIVRTYNAAGRESEDSNEVYYPLHHYRERLAVDFGSTGMYQYDGSKWSNIAMLNATQMIGNRGNLFVDFEMFGLYQFDGGSWLHINSKSAVSFVNWGAQIVVNFDSEGIELYQEGGLWQNLTKANPKAIFPTKNGFAADFKQQGLFVYSHNGWKYIHTKHPENSVSWLYGLAVDFGTDGLWNYSSKEWSQLAELNPYNIVAYRSGLAVDFGTIGMFYYDYDKKIWKRIAYWDPDIITPWKNGLAVSFPDHGIWNYNGSTWNQIETDTPHNMVAWAQGLAVDFEENGLWNFSDQYQTWEQLTALNPENIADFY